MCFKASPDTFNTFINQLDSAVVALERTRPCFERVLSDPMVEFRLPRKGALSGSILKHAYTVVEKILAAGPVVFKIGFTHCPTTRLRNVKFGYVRERQRWQKMVVVYASSEAVGPSFLEASLIAKYRGSLFLDTGSLWSNLMTRDLSRVSFACLLGFSFHGCLLFQGSEGCRNERLGGETVQGQQGGPFFTYVIYQSFRRASAAAISS